MIRVNNDWVIGLDQYSYFPMRDMHREKTITRKNRGTTIEHDYKGGYGYYTSLKGAVKAIAQVEYKNALQSRDASLLEAIKLMDDTLKRFEKILEGIKE
jgi:hypothetical protein